MTRPWTPPEMSSAEHHWAREWIGQYVPKQRPAFLRVWATDDGRTWAWRGGPGRRSETSEEIRACGGPPEAWAFYRPTEGYDVFDEAGRWLGHVATPEIWESDPFPGSHDSSIRGRYSVGDHAR